MVRVCGLDMNTTKLAPNILQDTVNLVLFIVLLILYCRRSIYKIFVTSNALGKCSKSHFSPNFYYVLSYFQCLGNSSAVRLYEDKIYCIVYSTC